MSLLVYSPSCPHSIDIIEYVKSIQTKKKKKYNFWILLDKDEQ